MDLDCDVAKKMVSLSNSFIVTKFVPEIQELVVKNTELKENSFKKGPFSRLEKNMVDEALKDVLQEEGYIFTKEQIVNFLSREKPQLPRHFWRRVAHRIPSRRVESIYDHTRRRLSTKNYRGKWMDDEVIHLKIMVQIYGFQWSKIASSLNRLPGACYDKWRDALKSGEERKKGKWSQEEKCKLIQLVTLEIGYEITQKKNTFNPIKWTIVAEKIGTRSYLQCRNEWARFFCPGSTLKLTLQNSLDLIETMLHLEISDETEIKWGNLLNGVPGHKTYNKWRSLCRKYLEKDGKKNNYGLSFKLSVFHIRNILTSLLRNLTFS